MKYAIRLTETADRQLYEIASYLLEETGDLPLAERIMNALDTAVHRLSDAPRLGVVPRSAAIRRQGYRMLVSEGYLIFYLCHDDRREIVVHAVVHAKQDYTRVVR